MIGLNDLSAYLEELLNASLVADYCPNGIQVEGKKEVRRIATGVSATLDTIQEAVAWKADALLVHHGLFWSGDSYIVNGPKKEKLSLLLENEISLIAYHLPLDMHLQLGNNWKAAQEMGWRNLQPFGFFKGLAIGVKGEVTEQPRDSFRKSLEAYYDHAAFCALGGKEVVKSVGLISGGAYKNVSDAVAEDLDCFVTGNFDEPAWNMAFEGKINFFALGHTATERIGPKALGEHLQKQFQLEYKFIDTQNPF